MIKRTIFFLFAPLLVAAPALAADSLGIFSGWGAFRDPAPAARCYAIAQPGGSARRSGAYASIAYWPRARIRGQFYARLSRPLAATAKPAITIGSARFALVGSGRNVWAADARSDAAIIAAIRSASTMRIAGDGYDLKGAATAIDAAALGCARAA
ncbi:MAG: hypothetical protein GW859_03355 [Sphingomonadales bacterium]|nr:hypothetical protein [Sphingomonadales bacterium]